MYIHEYSHGSKDDSACHYDTVLCSSQQRNSVNIHLSVKVNNQLLFVCTSEAWCVKRNGDVQLTMK